MRQHKIFKSSLYPQYFFDFTKTDNYFIFLWSESMTPLNCETFFSLIFPKLTPNSFRVFLHCIYHIVIDVYMFLLRISSDGLFCVVVENKFDLVNTTSILSNHSNNQLNS